MLNCLKKSKKYVLMKHTKSSLFFKTFNLCFIHKMWVIVANGSIQGMMNTVCT